MILNDFIPNEFDMDRLEKLGLLENGELTEKFKNVYTIYSNFLMKFISRKLDLKGTDMKIKSSSLRVKPVKEQDMDIYQSVSTLNYIYIRNTLNIEILARDEIEDLNNRYLEDDFRYDKDIIELIKGTYQDVIADKNYKNGTMINYGPEEVDCYAPNNAIVLGVRFDPDYDEERNNPNFLDEYNKKQILFATLTELLKEEGKDKFDIPVYAIQYNENMIIKKNNHINEMPNNKRR